MPANADTWLDQSRDPERLAVDVSALRNFAGRVTVSVIAKTVTLAHQDFQENAEASVEVGKLADLVVDDRNILSIDPHAISDIKTLTTIFDGKII